MSNAALLKRSVAAAFYGRFPELRPVQEATIPAIISGQNVVVSSGTGSGKTEAVVAPLLSRFWGQAVQSEALSLLYIAPTKALANDLLKRLEPALNQLGLRIGIRHGDRDDLAAGKLPHLLLTTPESLEVLLFRKEEALKTVRALVLDEVHLLYNSQRGLQLSSLIQRLKSITGAIQWAALSATAGRLSDVRDFLFGPAEQAVFFQFPSGRSIDSHIRHCPDEASFARLVRRLMERGPTKLLVFANSRRECERLAGVLHREGGSGPAVLAHYSSLSPEVRVETEAKFATSRAAICIATSTLELGIDIGDIDAVLLWGVPSSVESFLQRIGRGNRRSLKTNVVCIVPDDCADVPLEVLRFLALEDAARKGELTIRTPHELFGAVVQQCFSIIASDNGQFTRIADLCRVFETQGHLNRGSIEAILAEVANRGFLQRHGFKNQYGAAELLYELVDSKFIYGNFPVGSQTVDVLHRSQVLGTVPAVNLLRLRRGAIVRFAGRRWQVTEATAEGVVVELTQARGQAVDFIYPGAGVGFDAFLTDRMWQVLHGPESVLGSLEPKLKESMAGLVRSFRAICGPRQIPYYSGLTGVRYFTFGGYFVNRAIALATKQLEFTARDTYLDVATPIEWANLGTLPRDYESVFHQLFEATSAQSFFQTLLPVEHQRHEFLQEWLKNESVELVLTRLKESRPVELNILHHGLLPGH